MSKISNYGFEFKNAMFWNSIDSVIAQILVTTNHILLQTFAGSEFHGLFASYISLIYTGIPILNLGFDYSLSPYLKEFTRTKKNFLSLLVFQFLPQLFFASLLVFIISQPIVYRSLFSATFNPEIIQWLKYIFIIEYIRKSARSFLQLMLQSKTTAYVESFGTLFYMLTFWTSFLFLPINVSIIFALKVLTLSVFIQTSLLAVKIFHVFLSLENNSSDSHNLNMANTHHHMNKTRMGIWLNHILNQLNYSNVVIPFSNMCFGPIQASFLSVLMNSARCVTLFFQKGLGVSSLAFLSQTPTQSPSDKPTSSYTIHYLYNLSVPLFIFFFINSAKLSSLFSKNQLVWHIASLACFLSVIEGAISVYEKFYITEKKIFLFSLINSIGSIILFGATYKLLLFTNLTSFFVCFFLIRALSLVIIITLSHYLLKISSTPTLNRSIIIAVTLFSILFYLVF